MDTHRLWQKSLHVRRGLLCIFIAWHLFAMFMNNLPWSPLVARFFDIYHPYLTYTGTVQDGWAMYSEVHTTDNHYRLTGILPDGTERQLLFPGQTRPGMIANRFRDFIEERDGTFLESIGYGASDEVNMAFAAYLCREDRGSASVRMEMITAVTPPLADWVEPFTVDDYATNTIFSYDCSSL